METEALVRSRLAAFATVPDPRHPRGRRHPLPAMLALAPAARRCGARRGSKAGCHLAVGATPGASGGQGPRLHPAAAPSVATRHRIFRRLDVAAFEAVLQRWAQAHLGDGAEASASDGTGVRGLHEEELPGVRLVAAYAMRAGLVLAQSGGQG
jgi:hypothetical protein